MPDALENGDALYEMVAFDALIRNTDRNVRNIIALRSDTARGGYRLYLYDHDRALLFPDPRVTPATLHDFAALDDPHVWIRDPEIARRIRDHRRLQTAIARVHDACTDAARDEAINVGVVACGPAGSLFRTDPLVLDRMRQVDPYLETDVIHDIQEYMGRLTSRPAIQVSVDGIAHVEPWHPGLLDAIREQYPLRFTLGRTLVIEYPDTSCETLEMTAEELVVRLVTPVTHRAAAGTT